MAGGASAYQTFAHIQAAIQEKEFAANVTDVTDKMGVISLQGPESRNVLQKITDFELSDSNLPLYNSSLISINGPAGIKYVLCILYI